MAKKGTERGPVLTWNQDRDIALVSVIADGQATTPAEIAGAIKGMGEFAGVENAITPDKVRSRVNALRSAGANLPKFGRSFYKPDVDALNALL